MYNFIVRIVIGLRKLGVIFWILLIICVASSCNNRELSIEKVEELSRLNYDEKKQEEKMNDIEYLINIGEEKYNLNKLFNIKQLEDLDENDLGILRNAIYAKHGYKFKISTYREIFSAIEWYNARFSDVSNMLTDIDTQNINSIIEIEKTKKDGNHSKKVFETIIQVENKNYSYKIDFYLEKDLFARDDITFTHFIIYKINDGTKTMIFDSKNMSDEFEVICTSSKVDEIIKIDDKDKDRIEEIYLRLEDILGYEMTLVINNFNNEYIESFCGYESDELEYKDINKDGIMELINDHCGGGGYVSYWVGLDLVNELQGNKYEFSYDLTKLYYESIKEKIKSSFVISPTPKHFVELLNAYADLGMPEKCNDLIKKYPELVNNKEFDYSECYDAPAENYFDFVIYRARSYTSVWEEMKNWSN